MNLREDITFQEIRARGYLRGADGYQYPAPGRMWLDVRALLFMIEDLEHEVALARQHLAVCPVAQKVEEYDRDQAASNR